MTRKNIELGMMNTSVYWSHVTCSYITKLTSYKRIRTTVCVPVPLPGCFCLMAQSPTESHPAIVSGVSADGGREKQRLIGAQGERRLIV
ncbi:uncharacterized protein ACO6RY_16991 [Pungitius sinensis]